MKNQTERRPLILIVDDDPNALSMVGRVLETDGYTIKTASDGLAALEQFAELRPDLVLLDCMMPMLDGFETCKRLRALPGGAETPIVMVTALDDEASIRRSAQAGAVDHITKPIKWQLFRDRIANLLLMKQSEQALRNTDTTRYQASELAKAFRSERDIRRQTEAALQETEASFRNMFFGNPHPMWIYDVKTLVFLDVNEMAIQHYGYSREEFLELRTIDLLLEKDVPAALQTVAERGNRVVNHAGHWRHRLKNGQLIDVEITSHLLEYKGRPAACVLAQDITERKRMEEALAHERNMLRTLIDQLPDYIFIKDRAGRFMLSNVAHAQAVHATPDELVGKTAADFFPAVLAAQYDKDDQTLMESGEPQINMERLSVDADGRTRAVLTTKVPLIDKQGNITALVGLSRDITERKHMEQELAKYQANLERLVEERTAELRQTNERLQLEITQRETIGRELQRRIDFESLIATISTQFVALEEGQMETGINYTLQAVADFAGADRSFAVLVSENGDTINSAYEWRGEGVLPRFGSPDMLPDDVVLMWLRNISGLEQTYDAQRHGRPGLTQSGFGKSFVAIPMIFGASLIGFIGFDSLKADKEWSDNSIALLRMVGEIIANAVSHQRTATALQASEEQLRRITDNMLDMLCQTDMDGTIEYASPSCWGVLGYQSNSLLGQSIYEWVHPEDLEQVKEAVESVGRAEYRYRHANGEYLWMETLISLLFDETGKLKSMVFASRNVTERKRAEQELHALNQLKTEFLSTAAHELRTPLTSIRGFSEILLTRQLDEARHRRYINLISEQSTHLAHIIDDLLDVSRLEAKQHLSLTLESVNVASLMSEVALPFIETASKHTIRVEGLEECPAVKGDRMRLSQVAKNLLSNAVKYSPEGGTVTIHAHEVPGLLQISIADQGMGMTPEEQQHLFEKFYRADMSNTAINGTGLGLAISKLIVELHGGYIWAESERGTGTTFHFTVPLATEPLTEANTV